jgi:hypothetical protein
MGLDTSHDCWHGPYSSFMSWREWLAGQIGIPLRMMEGFADYQPRFKDLEMVEAIMPLGLGDTACFVQSMVRACMRGFPVRWQGLSDPLNLLLSHSDCNGRIKWYECRAIAVRLSQLLRTMRIDKFTTRANYDRNYEATKRFALGLAKAWRERRDVMFH